LIRRLANTPDDVALGTELVREYVTATAAELGQDLAVILPLVPDVHDFAGRYFPRGGFLVAEIDDTVAGCLGITPLDDGVCEMNRLWVRAGYRRRGLARDLCDASLDAARDFGFTRMILDVAPTRTTAIALYRSLGFAPTPPAHEYPFEMVFLGRDL
jgi:ribosomal protein S18 acetylase RimI-like enzyme